MGVDPLAAADLQHGAAVLGIFIPSGVQSLPWEEDIAVAHASAQGLDVVLGFEGEARAGHRRPDLALRVPRQGRLGDGRKDVVVMTVLIGLVLSVTELAVEHVLLEDGAERLAVELILDRPSYHEIEGIGVY